MKCEYEGCHLKAKYALYRFDKTTKKWVNVCDEHDREIVTANAQFKRKYGLNRVEVV